MQPDATAGDALGNSNATTYTANSDVQQYTDAAGQVTIYNYSTDGKNNLISAQGPTGFKTSWQYTDSTHSFLPTSMTDPQSNTLSLRTTRTET